MSSTHAEILTGCKHQLHSYLDYLKKPFMHQLIKIPDVTFPTFTRPDMGLNRGNSL